MKTDKTEIVITPGELVWIKNWIAPRPILVQVQVLEQADVPVGETLVILVKDRVEFYAKTKALIKETELFKTLYNK